MYVSLSSLELSGPGLQQPREHLQRHGLVTATTRGCALLDIATLDTEF